MGARRFRPAARVALFLAAQGRCAACGEPLRRGWHADHVEPVSGGGATEPANGQALCPRCNLVKGARRA
jgi:5-methylcytosine-specific restriction endonuclease McrA